MTMDLITSLSKLQEYDVIMVMVERFANLAHMVLIVTIATVLETAYLILKGWWRHHGLPRVIVSDHDLKFKNAF